MSKDMFILRQTFADRLPPLHVKIGYFVGLVQFLQFRMESLVLLVLPFSAGGIAEKHPATKRANGVDGTKFVLLKGATGGGI